MTTPNAASVAASMSDSVRDQLARKHAVYLTSASVLEILEEALSSAPQQTADEKDALLRQALDADGDSLTIAYLHGFANGKDAALTASTAHPSPAQAQQPVSGADELLALARAALEPFADLGAWLFARNLPDDTPMVDVVHINNVKTTLTRGHFKAAHSAATDIDAALDAAVAADRAQAAPAAPQPAQPLTDEQRRFLLFLEGAADWDGVWFGERHPSKEGAFWWRKDMRQVFYGIGVKND